jgi:L-malate glycosyltransferase
MIEVLSEGSSSAWAKHSPLPHVLLVVDQFPMTLGGGERVVLKLARLLPQYGFRTSILTFFAHPDCAALRPAPCPIYLLPLMRTYDWTAIRGAFALKKFLRVQQVQLVQTFFESSDLWAGFTTKAMSDAKLVWSRRDMGILRGRKHEVAYRLMAGMPDMVFAVSNQVRRHCIEVDGIDPARVETVYSGVDVVQQDTDAGPQKRGSDTMITTVGNIRRVKGHDLLIRAAGMIAPRFPDVTFSVAGAVLEQDYFAQLKELVTELGLEDRFLFLGGISDLRNHLAGSDIFVLPSRSEGFSNAIIEAMAAGLPVVATDVGGNTEAVEDGVNGFILPPENADELAKAIAELLGNPARAQKMGAAGKAIVTEKFTTEAMMRHIAGVYRRLLTEN